MAAYLALAVIVLALVLVLRRYFGSKYESGRGSRCDSCPYAKSCKKRKKENIDKIV